MNNRNYRNNMKPFSKTKLKSKLSGCCNRRQFIAATALLSGSANLLATNTPLIKEAENGIEANQSAPVHIPFAAIRMRSPNSALFGITSDEIIEITYAEVLKFHGYCAGGAAFAFRMAQEAFKALYGDQLPIRQDIKVQTSHHCCQAAALAYITGARSDFGAFRSQGDLVLIPEEEEKTIFTDKPSGRTITLKMHLNPHDTFEPLFKRAMKDPEFAPQVHKALNEKINEYLTAPVETLFTIDTTGLHG
jgi:formylmethanofuran dehydrogenase subunit E